MTESCLVRFLQLLVKVLKETLLRASELVKSKETD